LRTIILWKDEKEYRKLDTEEEKGLSRLGQIERKRRG